MTARRAVESTDNAGNFLDQRAIAESGRALADGMEAWFATASECQREMADFASHRLAKDGDAMREILDCKNPADAMQIHARWVQEMIRDYGAEMTRILAITTRHAGNAAQRKH